LVAFPTDTVYGLGADVFNPAALARLFAVKGRSAERAVPVLLADAGDATVVTPGLPPAAAALARAFWPGPLTLVVRRLPSVPDAVAGAGDTIGIRVPDHPLPRALARGLGRPVTGTSANSSGQPPHRDAEGVRRDLGAGVDYVMPGECGPYARPSTVVDCTRTPAAVLREGALTLEELRAVWPDVDGPGAAVREAGAPATARTARSAAR
jgi:L-threonylcarbamoyladenylate synthase